MTAPRLLAFAAALIAGGCALTPSATHEAVRYFDLGPALSSAHACRFAVGLDPVQAGPALQGTRMWYRSESHPFEPAAFAISRWVAPPAHLLQQHIGAALAVGPETFVRLNLTVVRMELQLSNDTNARSYIELKAVATGRNPTPPSVRFFALSHHAERSPAGAARAMALSINDWTTELCEWLDDRRDTPSTEQE